MEKELAEDSDSLDLHLVAIYLHTRYDKNILRAYDAQPWWQKTRSLCIILKKVSDLKTQLQDYIIRFSRSNVNLGLSYVTLVRQIWQQCCLGAFIPSKYRHRSFIYDIGSEMWILVKQMWLWSFKYNHRFNLFFQALYTSTKTVYNYAKDVKEQVISNLNVVSLQYCSSLDMLTKSIQDGLKDVLMNKEKTK